MIDLHQFFGTTSGVLTLAGLLLYAKSVVIGFTKPSQATWAIWTINSFLLLTSYSASGAKETLWLAMGYAIGLSIITMLTMKFGERGWNWLDRLCLIGAVLGILLWWATGSPLTAFFASLIIDLFGVIPTIQKSWYHPKEEDKLSWSILLIGGVMSIFAINKWSITIAVYPIQITITTALIVLFLFRRQFGDLPKNL